MENILNNSNYWHIDRFYSTKLEELRSEIQFQSNENQIFINANSSKSFFYFSIRSAELSKMISMLNENYKNINSSIFILENKESRADFKKLIESININNSQLEQLLLEIERRTVSAEIIKFRKIITDTKLLSVRVISSFKSTCRDSSSKSELLTEINNYSSNLYMIVKQCNNFKSGLESFFN